MTNHRAIQSNIRKLKPAFALLLVLSFGLLQDASASHQTVQTVGTGNLDAEVAPLEEILSVVIKNVSDNQPYTGSVVSFPDGVGVVTAAYYLEVSFQSNGLGAAIIISTDNRRVPSDNRGPAANPAFKSGEDGIIGTADDEAFQPWTGVSGAGLVGTRTKSHGYAAPIFWVVFDNPIPGGYTFAADYGKEAVVLDHAQTHAFSGPNGALQPEPFDSPSAQAYASIIVAPNFVNGSSIGLIASYPTDIDGSANGNSNGLRPATSPVIVYLGANLTGMPGPNTYATNTLRLELVHQ